MLGALHLRPDQAPGRQARPGRAFGSRCFDRANLPAGSGQGPRYAENSRLPEEAKYLASLPAAKAIAVRLDTRAARERARTGPDRENPVTARWAWSPIAAVVLPALALLIIVLA